MEKLLIVDDEEAIRRLLRINLEDRYEILDTGVSGQALALAMQSKPDAILLDLRMPNYSGFELCRTLKSMSSTQLIPIFIISGEGGANTKLFCEELGAAAYFQKPVDFAALRASLTSVLRAAQVERRHETRVHLRVRLKLLGIDMDEKHFEEATITENLSKNAFFCGCTVPLRPEMTVEVNPVDGGLKFNGRASVVRSEGCGTPYPRYAFRFTEKSGDWILQ